jgi:DNA sulfur modification protein DndD
MIIRSITLNNYRLYKGVNTISFEQKKDKNIFLISGENGFGKTTFLYALIWCLYGKLITDIETDVRKDILYNGYNSFLNSNMNFTIRQHCDKIPEDEKEQIKKRGYNPDNEYLREYTQYYVSIEFMDVVIPSLPCTNIKIIRSFDIVTGKEDVEILIDGKKDELTKEIGPEVFINDFILNKDIARFFFFDSEQIVSLAEINTINDRRHLCSAYNEVLGVRKYEDLMHNIENVRLRFRKKSSDIESRKKLIALLDKKESLTKSIEAHKEKISQLDDNLQQLRSLNDSLQVELMREGNNATISEIKNLERIIAITTEKNEEYKKKLHLLLEYAPLAIIGKLFESTKQQLVNDHEIEQANNNKASRTLIVSDITNDIINTLKSAPITQELSVELQLQIQDILNKYKENGSHEEVLLSMSNSDYDEFMSVYNNLTITYRSEFVRLADDYKKNKQMLERNSRKLSIIQSKENDSIIKDIRNKKNQVEFNISDIEQEIRQAHEILGNINQNLATTSKQVSELSKKVSLDDSDIKNDKVAEQLINELSVFLQSLKQEKKFSLERRMKGILNTLLHKEDFIGHIEVIINDEGMDIELYSPDNIQIIKDSLSKGEQQLYATSLLKALVDESGIQFPVFIDSPLQKFDKTHSKKIITEFYPNISKQVVLFPLLYKELTPDEFNVMKPFVNGTYLIKNDTTRSYFEKVQVNNFLTTQKNV